MSEPPQQAPPPPDDLPPPGSATGTGQPGAWQSGPAGQQPPPQRTGNGIAVAALVCGVIALIVSWVPFVNVVAILLGIAAIVCGIAGIRRAGRHGGSGRGMAIGGLVTGALGLLFALFVLVGIIAALNDPAFREPFQQLMEGEDPDRVIEELERQLEQP